MIKEITGDYYLHRGSLRPLGSTLRYDVETNVIPVQEKILQGLGDGSEVYGILFNASYLLPHQTITVTDNQQWSNLGERNAVESMDCHLAWLRW